MNDKEHSDNGDDDTPAGILDYSSKEDRDTTDKDAENRNKTREECDTSKREDVGKYEAPVETELPVKESYDDQSYECQNCICDGYFTLSAEYESKTFLYFLQEYLDISVEKCKGSSL